jgi:hypothetical protein
VWTKPNYEKWFWHFSSESAGLRGNRAKYFVGQYGTRITFGPARREYTQIKTGQNEVYDCS